MNVKFQSRSIVHPRLPLTRVEFDIWISDSFCHLNFGI
jgi:hypothetical protein